jgi:hypothetical protein
MKGGSLTFEGIAGRYVNQLQPQETGTMHDIRQSAGNKEEIMKSLIYIAVFLMIGLIVMGCTGMTTEQRKEGTSLSASVGDAPFVGFSSTESHELADGMTSAGGQGK